MYATPTHTQAALLSAVFHRACCGVCLCCVRVQIARAAHLLERATELHPEFTMAHFNLGLAYRSLRRRDDARVRLDRCARHGGVDGGCVARGGNTACVCAHRAVALDPLFGKARAYLGQHLLEYHVENIHGGIDPNSGARYLDLARTQLEKAPGQGCTLALLYFARGTTAMELGYPGAAVEYVITTGHATG